MKSRFVLLFSPSGRKLNLPLFVLINPLDMNLNTLTTSLDISNASTTGDFKSYGCGENGCLNQRFGCHRGRDHEN